MADETLDESGIVAKLREALEALLAEARERGGSLSKGEVLGCAALNEATPNTTNHPKDNGGEG